MILLNEPSISLLTNVAPLNEISYVLSAVALYSVASVLAVSILSQVQSLNTPPTPETGSYFNI